VPFAHFGGCWPRTVQLRIGSIDGAGHSVILERAEESRCPVGLVDRVFAAAHGHGPDYAAVG